ncbi:hypothetical protein [Mycobacterium sp.]|uniref:hypothetical protein n=1 Tax=Mycobacterium sp. TaxID=1785 RepID=UPI003C40DAD0
MTTDVNVLGVFTDADGKFENSRGVVAVGATLVADRQRVGTELCYSETTFIDDPMPWPRVQSASEAFLRAKKPEDGAN